LAVGLMASAAPALAQSFQGFHADATVGYDRVGARVSDGTSSIKGHKSGVVFGAAAGWDFQAGSLVFGPYGGIDFATTKRCTPIFGNDKGCAKAKRNFEAGGRLGAVVGDKTLLYGKVAYVNGRATLSYTDFSDATNNLSLSDNRGGIRFGAGASYMLSSSLYVTGEYRYTKYDTYRDAASGVSLRINRHQAVGGIGVHF
jgi:outer membrane immunogenic protein